MGDSSIITHVGQTVRDTYERLGAAKRDALADQIGVDQRILKGLVDDVGIIVAEWICCPPITDPYSTPEVQKFIESAVTFLKAVQSHDEALDGLKSGALGAAIDCPSSKHLAQVWRGVNGERASSGVGF